MTFSLAVSLLFFAGALIGVIADTIVLGICIHWVRRSIKQPTAFAGISVLKPLCGVDDELEKNLEEFARLDYPNFEVVLGVKNAKDPAYPVAQAAVARWPNRFRLVLQRGEPGMNPKVNQLITMGPHARHDILVVSDSNVRVPRGYLHEIAAHFEDPQVACVTSPIVGVGERRLGSLMDNLHLGSAIGSGIVAAKVGGGQDIVVGKSMALRRSDLMEMGGFEAAKNHLAEDYVLGLKVRHQLGKRVAVCRLPVYNVSLNRSVKDFFNRYLRWGVIHRTSITFPTYLGQGFLNFVPFALLGFLARPTVQTGVAVLLLAAYKIFLDIATARQFREQPFGLRAVGASMLKDALIFATWVNGLYDRTVVWRGNRLRVHHGSRLVPLEEPVAVPAQAMESANAWSEGNDPGNRRAA